MAVWKTAARLALYIGLASVAPLGLAAEDRLVNFGRDVDAASEERMLQLRASVGYDGQLDEATKRPSDADFVALTAAAEGGPVVVRRAAASLIERLFAQRLIDESAKDLERIDRMLGRIESISSAAPDDATLAAMLDRIRWRITLARVKDPEAKAALLRSFVEDRRQDGVFYSYQSLSLLRDLGPSGERILRALDADSRRRDLGVEVVKRVNIGLECFQLDRQLRSSRTDDASTRLLIQRLEPLRQDQSASAQEFGVWIVRRLQRFASADNVALRAIADDSSLAESVRHAAALGLTAGSPAERSAAP